MFVDRLGFVLWPLFYWHRGIAIQKEWLYFVIGLLFVLVRLLFVGLRWSQRWKKLRCIQM